MLSLNIKNYEILRLARLMKTFKNFGKNPYLLLSTENRLEHLTE